MAYKCKNCGKFVAKNAAVCKHCGQDNPAELIVSSGDAMRKKSNTDNSFSINENDTNFIQCPNCGSQLSLPEKFRKDYYLHCNICHQEFANPLKSIGRSENYLKKHGCLIIVVVIVLLSVIGYFVKDNDRIKADSTTVYIITKDIYAPSTEDAAKDMINAMAKNGSNDVISNFEHIYNNDANFTHVFVNDKVVVLRKISSGYLIRKLRDYKTAVIPNDSYLKNESE